MPFLNPPDVLPEAMRFIARAVMLSDNALLEDELSRMVAPLGLVEAMGGEGLQSDEPIDNTGRFKAGGRTIVRASLAAMRGSGIVEASTRGSRSVSLAPSFCENFSSWKAISAEAFANFVRVEVLGRTSTYRDSDEETGGAEDLASAISLILSMPRPLRPIGTFEHGDGKTLFDYQTDQFGSDIAAWVVRNRERYNPLIRWATYLGFGRLIQGGLLVDPSVALRSLTGSVVDREMPLAEFLQRLATVMPLSDGGLIGQAVRSRLADAPDPRELSPGLALGLLVLHARKHIRLSPQSDAESLAFPVNTERDIRFSHIAPGASR